ncbi:MAG: macro domain-containing protein [Acidimicrobiales bacterium]|nr:macro domain-containing protein [Acidimicrobiales bacterium]
MRAFALNEAVGAGALAVIRGDITALKVDAIVNAANSALSGGGGVDGAIHAAAGPTVLRECQAIIDQDGPCATGSAVVTSAGDLPAKWVIHTVGPIWEHHGPVHSATLLSDCYTSSLDAAADVGATSIAFSAISTGVYGFPKELAAPIAVSAIASWFEENLDRSAMHAVTLVCFDEFNFQVTQQAISDLNHRK